MFPSINPCPIAPDFVTGSQHDCDAGGSHLVKIDGGYFDAMDALHDLTAALRSRRVDIRFGAKVAACGTLKGAISQITLASGEIIACQTLVCAADPWCNDIYRQLGLNTSWPLSPTRIQALHINRPPAVKGHIPVVADPTGGIYFRTQNRGQQIVVSSVLEEDEKEVIAEPDNCPTFADDEYIHIKLFALQHRVMGLDNITGLRGYSGLYTINQRDVHPVVGATPIAGFSCCKRIQWSRVQARAGNRLATGKANDRGTC